MKKTILTLLFLLAVICLKAQDDVTITKIDSGKIFTTIEQVPEFPGGLEEFSRFLSTNIIYPKIARQNKTEGRVLIRFVVQRDGSITDLKILRGVSKEIDNEALRVLAICPKWKPGMQKGRAVRCSYVVPITFSLN